MVAVLAAASYSRGGFIPCLAVSARPVMVPGGSTFHLEHGTLGGGGASLEHLPPEKFGGKHRNLH